MAGLGKHEMRERGRAFKPGAWDDKDGTREACWQAKASSVDFHSSSVKANTRLQRLFPLWAAQQQELVSEMAGSSPGDLHPVRSATAFRTGRGRCFGLVHRECKDGQRNSQKGTQEAASGYVY